MKILIYEIIPKFNCNEGEMKSFTVIDCCQISAAV
jgi:hypothetical protein